MCSSQRNLKTSGVFEASCFSHTESDFWRSLPDETRIWDDRSEAKGNCNAKSRYLNFLLLKTKYDNYIYFSKQNFESEQVGVVL